MTKKSYDAETDEKLTNLIKDFDKDIELKDRVKEIKKSISELNSKIEIEEKNLVGGYQGYLASDPVELENLKY